MLDWNEISQVHTNDGSTLVLRERCGRFEIRVDGYELMGSRAHGSEDLMAEIGCARLQGKAAPSVLIGGLGMGYTLRATLDSLPSTASVTVAELIAEVIAWNKDYLGHLAGHPLEESRVRMVNGDVMGVWRDSPGGFDLILMDVDNGACALTASSNDALYQVDGLSIARSALKPGGLMAFWCADPDETFVKRVKGLCMAIRRIDVPALGVGGGPLHTLYFVAESEGALPE